MNYFLISLPFTSILSFSLGIFVIVKQPRKLQNVAWGLACVMCGFWSGGMFLMMFAKSYVTALFFARISQIAATWMMTFITQFCVELVGGRSSKNFFVKISYLASTFFAVSAPLGYLTDVHPFLNFNYYFKIDGLVYYAFTATVVFQCIYTQYLLINGYLKSTQPSKNQILYVTLALAIGYPGGLMSFLPAYGVPWHPTALHFTWIYTAFITYAIVKHRLLDIHVVIKRTFVYSVWILGISFLYLLLVGLTHLLVVDRETLQQYWANFSTFNLFTLSAFLCGILSVALTVFTFFFGKTKSQRIFIWYNLCVSIWGLGNFAAVTAKTPEGARWGWIIAYCGGYFISSIFYHLVTEFFVLKKTKTLYLAYAHSIIFLIATIIWPSSFVNETWTQLDLNFNKPTIPMTAAIVCFLAIATATFIRILKHYHRTTGRVRIQCQYFLAGFAVGYLGGLTSLFPQYGIGLGRSGHLGVAAYVAIFFYAIFKYELLDIRVVIRRTIIYSLIIASASALYLGFVFFMHSFISKNNKFESQIFINYLSILFIAIIFKPFEIFMHKYIERRFFKGTISEIADQKERLESELERTERLKSVGILAAGMAHEIKNPITAINTFAEYLPSKYDDPEFRSKFTRIVTHETQRIKNIVTDLLEFSKPQEPRRSVCQLNEILRGTTDLLAGDLMKYRIELTTKYEADDRVNVDPNQIKQALLNILMNAIDSMAHTGGQLIVGSERTTSGLIISIQDTGDGIPTDKLTHIFDPFYSSKDRGTGLGLAITHSLIRSNGGRIEVSSQVGQGTEFRIYLPSSS